MTFDFWKLFLKIGHNATNIYHSLIGASIDYRTAKAKFFGTTISTMWITSIVTD